MHRVAVYWLRRDLRLADNPALRFACEHAESVVFAYLDAPDEEAPWSPGAASRWWLYHGLEKLAEELGRRKQSLVIRSGASLRNLQSLIRESGATLVVWNRLYEPAVIERDAKIKSTLREANIEVHSFNAGLLFEPWQVKTQQDQPYKVFTPFWRACVQRLSELGAPGRVPKNLRPHSLTLHSAPLATLGLLPDIRWDTGIAKQWQPGEQGAHRALKSFVATACDQYPTARDTPAVAGTSRLSPHLHFGEIGPRQVVAALLSEGDGAKTSVGRDHYFREIGWREFAHHVLFHFPKTTNKPFDERFENYAWEKRQAVLRAWQRGRTGFPIVDAGMRELWETGYVHNRVRMLVASLLTKNMRIHWLEGARWFWDTLVDADLANNTLGWQWTAGCGTDAAPYFRIFNPQLQSERFDPAGIYLRRWLPELAKLSNRSIHAPHLAPESELKAAGVVLGKTYPRPVVDLKESREVALSNFKKLR